MINNSDWAGKNSEIGTAVESQFNKTMDVYRSDWERVRADSNTENNAAQGDYSRRQVFELIQNGADQLLGQRFGKVHLVLTNEAMYAANEGDPIDRYGVTSMMLNNVSNKTGNQIGRFGLGFNSVLAVTDTPLFIGKTGSFEFSRERSKEVLEGLRSSHYPENNPLDGYPVLTLAWPIEGDQQLNSDPIVKELSLWATTVIKLPFKSMTDAQKSRVFEPFYYINKENENKFPAEFMLFTQHVDNLVLEDRTVSPPLKRTVTMKTTDDNTYIISDSSSSGIQSAEWHVFTEEIRLTESQIEDAQNRDISKRKIVPVQWAISTTEGNRGKFWNFFPTTSDVTLSGIVNAPWKTGGDRVSLLQSSMNEGLIESAAKLVVSNLGKILDKSDPGNILDLLPARGDEESSWAAEQLVKEIETLRTDYPSIPDQDGELRTPDELCYLPGKYISEAAAEIWNSSPDRPTGYYHPSVFRGRDRFPTADRLIEDGLKQDDNIIQWLESLINPDPEDAKRYEQAVRAIGTASKCIEDCSNNDLREELKGFISRSAILIKKDGLLSSPGDKNLYISPESDLDKGTFQSLNFVHPKILKFEGIEECLSILGLSKLSKNEQLKILLTEENHSTLKAFGTAPESWDSFWNLFNSIEDADQQTVYTSKNATTRLKDIIHVKTLSGKYNRISQCMIAGEICNSTDDSDIAVDPEHHDHSLEWLKNIFNLSSEPEAGVPYEDETWCLTYKEGLQEEYLKWYTGEYLKDHPEAPVPDRKLLGLTNISPIGPLQPLFNLSNESKVRFTKKTLDTINLSDLDPCVLRHSSNNNYPAKSFESPLKYFLRYHGLLKTIFGEYVAPAECAGPGLTDWAPYLNILEIDADKCLALGVPNDLNELMPSKISHLMESLDEQTPPKLLGEFYCSYANMMQDNNHVKAPDTLWCLVGTEMKKQVHQSIVCTSDRLQQARCREVSTPVLLVEDQEKCEMLIKAYELKRYEDLVEEYVSPADKTEPKKLTDLYPSLGLVLSDEQKNIAVVGCKVITLTTRDITKSEVKHQEISEYMDQEANMLLYVLDHVTDEDLMRIISRELELSLKEEDIEDFLNEKTGEDQRIKENDVRALDNDELRIKSMLNSEQIRSKISDGIVNAIRESGEKITDDGLPKIALSIFGINTLKEYNNELKENGFSPPAQWAGSTNALNFTRNLGFSDEFAGVPSPDRTDQLLVPGKIDLPKPHDYQKKVIEKLKDLLNNDYAGTNGQIATRGLISLPTGSGKTRVAVQGIIEWITNSAQMKESLIVWVAPKDELCEQAVQSWQEAWRAIGPSSEMQISRLWSTNQTAAFPQGHHVVVATIDKIDRIMQNYPESYEWLFRPNCVIIDEGHRETTRRYRRFRQKMGLEDGTNKDTKFIGMTATPFRGFSTEENEKLADVFQNNRLDLGVFNDDDPYPELQKDGFLSHIIPDNLEGTEESIIDLLEQKGSIGGSLPIAVLTRIGERVDRTNRLVKHITEHVKKVEDSSILVFCPSVPNAEVVAALLNMKDIPSACIHRDSDYRGVYVDQFKSGDLKVLTNYGVLTEGFDAPSVDAIYVARPIYSPNDYAQIIGRGLRGPKNGGKKDCYIIDVGDTVKNFGGEKISLDKHFRYLWDEN